MSGRVVIVTGASSGIGEATARAFGRAGDRVVLVARRVGRLQQLAAGLPDALVVPADLTHVGDVERVPRAALARYGRIDVLVNNAGLGRYDWLEDLPVAEIETQLQVNLLAPILLTRAVLPAMLAQRRGVIVNVGSVAGRIATPTMSVYNAAKFGLDGFSEALRREVGPQGIHVCLIAPGPVAGTEFGAHGAAEGGLRALRGRWGRLRWLHTDADRVAAAIVQLADRPRPRHVLPGIYRAMIAVNALAPGLVDRIVGRAAQAARPTERPPAP
jgi:short-subunit dehydrogenase